MKHFLEINALSFSQINHLIQKALQFKNQKIYPKYPEILTANLFYENSTRTRVSFEVAAHHLGMHTIHLSLADSSESKGESIADTILNLGAMGVSLFVIRHKLEGLPQQMAEVCPRVGIINAGDGKQSHPTQAMLDLMTIIEKKGPDLSRLKIVIVGDLLHSRVANSLQEVFSKAGIKELVLVGPKVWLPNTVYYGRTSTTLKEEIPDADVIIGLRVQKERLAENENLDLQLYRKEYALTQDLINTAKNDVLIMHPGPLNRGLEIDNNVADGPSSLILEQVTNGVFMRMAILDELALCS